MRWAGGWGPSWDTSHSTGSGLPTGVAHATRWMNHIFRGNLPIVKRWTEQSAPGKILVSRRPKGARWDLSMLLVSQGAIVSCKCLYKHRVFLGDPCPLQGLLPQRLLCPQLHRLWSTVIVLQHRKVSAVLWVNSSNCKVNHVDTRFC